MNDPIRVLVLGSYSGIGRQIARGILDQTTCSVRATGRDPVKLASLESVVGPPRGSLAALDATDRDALTRACQEADVVVNCVGPYIVNGYEIARTVVEARRHYLDFAFEQFHYRRLGELDALAKANGVALVVGAGETVGLSSVIPLHLAAKLGELQDLAIYYAGGELHEGNSGFAGYMNGALEPALDNQAWVDGRFATANIGEEIVERDLPAPYGRTRFLGDPTIDSLILPPRIAVRTIRSYFGIGMEIPRGFFPLMRLLNPYRNRLFYDLTARIVRRIMRKNKARQADRTGPRRDPMLQIIASSSTSTSSVELHFRDGFNGTAILPVLICRMFAEGEVADRGLLTAIDLVSPERLFAELVRRRERGELDLVETGPSARPAANAA